MSTLESNTITRKLRQELEQAQSELSKLRKRMFILVLAGGVSLLALLFSAGTVLYMSRSFDELQKQNRFVLEQLENTPDGAVSVKEQKRGDELVHYMLFDLRHKLSRAGNLNLVNDTMMAIVKYYRYGEQNSNQKALWKKAESLGKLGAVHKVFGKLEKAENAYSVAIVIVESLLSEQPEKIEWSAALALWTDGLGDIYNTRGSGQMALERYKKALKIQTKLYEDRPEEEAAQLKRLELIYKIAALKRKQGDPIGALEDYQAGIDLCKNFRSKYQTNAQWSLDLLKGIHKVGELHVEAERFEDAEALYLSTFEIHQDLKKLQPELIEREREQLVDYNRLAEIYKKLDRPEDALKYYQLSVELCNVVVAGLPEDLKWKRLQLISYTKLGALQKKQKNTNDALTTFQTATRISSELVELQPDDLTAHKDLLLCYSRLGELQTAVGDSKGAMNTQALVVPVFQRLVELEPDNAQIKRDLCVTYVKLGDLRKKMGDLEGAEETHQLAVDSFRDLTKEDPQNHKLQRDFSVSYEKIGDIRRARNNLEGAEASYRESLMIRKKLSAKFPKNNDWQRDLSVSYDRVGDVLKIRKKVDDAKQMYLDSLNIRKKLAAKELNNVLWQTDLVASYGKVAIVLKNGSDEDRAEARRMLLEALKLLNRLNEQKLLGPEHKKWIPLTKKLLTEIPEIPQIPLKKDPEINTPKNTPTMEQNVPLENPNQQIAPLQKPIPQDPPPRKKIPQNTPLVPTPDIP